MIRHASALRFMASCAMLAAIQCRAEKAFLLGDVSEVVYEEGYSQPGIKWGHPRDRRWGPLACRNLASALSKVAGREIRSVREDRQMAKGGVKIFVGDTKAARAEGLDARPLRRGEFRIVTKPGRAFILANTGMAANYGVAEFLQRYADYWFCLISGDDPYEVAPEREVPVADFAARHAIYARHYNCWGKRYARTCQTTGAGFTIRARCRSWYELEAEERVSSLPGKCHTYFAYCQPEKYAKDHPEYFSMGADGLRHAKANSGSQLCLTNPDVFEIVYSNLCAFVEKDRAELGEDAPHIYDFSQMDNCDYICLCPECSKVIAKYDRKGGHKDGGDAGLQLEFVNRLARKIRVKHPDIIVRTFAYVSTEEPPNGIEPEENVMIWLCDLYSKCDDMLPLAHPFNRHRLELVKEWAARSKKFEIWDYYLHDGTWAGVDAIAADIRLFRDIGITRINNETFFIRQPFYELHMFVTSQLYFDPDQDLEMLVSKWCRVYGRGAAKMKAAIDFLRGIILANPPVSAANWHMGVWPWRTPENMEKFCALVRAAYAEEAEGSKYRARMAAPLADVAKYLMRYYKVTPGCETDYARARADYRKYALEDLTCTGVAPADAERDRKDVEKTLALMDLEFHDLPPELASAPKSEMHFVDWRNMYAYGNEKVTNGVPEKGGVAFRWTRWMPGEPKKPPFNCSMLDEDLQTNHLHPFTPPADGKWHWIKIATDRLGRAGWVGMPYVGDNSISFRVQHLYVECDGLDADPNWYEMWISCKYGGDVADPEKGLFVDRLVLRRREKQR